MPLSRDSRDIRKAKIILRNELTLKQRLDRVDYEEDVVIPIVEAILAGKAVPELELKKGYLLDNIEIVRENHLPSTTNRPETGDSDRTGTD